MEEIKRILMIDDDRHMHRILQLYLRNSGIVVDGVSSGRLALHKLEQETYDLVLTDIQMPGMDGKELIQKIRKKLPEIPILIISAYEEEKFEAEIKTMKKIQMVAKPFDQTTILEKIRALLNSNDISAN
ncbi:response regulator receiver protein [Caldithrix abyssi DSM 13497]|uniref:Response regulator receiver protein n=1 Tax=Caldithrix abyssi DSM 13497 TaxID=880073 RepID=H1XQR4_CALAY|nr:response regulator [Caldithrix abyssi]APF18324.1 two-component system, OmpR family, response regulator ChvI [Caldithrix abyssi DSM 13497]EHO42337.1 response regulator receiver protein [Caldithrix abyssi DSM 13497]